jgi:hypothetical protein
MTQSLRAMHLLAASASLVRLVETISADAWDYVATPREWSVGKDAEHVADGNALHRWVVRSALQQHAGKRPPVERKEMLAQMNQSEVIRLLRQRTQESLSLIEALSDEQLKLPCRTRTLGAFIDRVLIGHYQTHQRQMEAKLRQIG